MKRFFLITKALDADYLCIKALVSCDLSRAIKKVTELSVLFSKEYSEIKEPTVLSIYEVIDDRGTLQQCGSLHSTAFIGEYCNWKPVYREVI